MLQLLYIVIQTHKKNILTKGSRETSIEKKANKLIQIFSFPWSFFFAPRLLDRERE